METKICRMTHISDAIGKQKDKSSVKSGFNQKKDVKSYESLELLRTEIFIHISSY